MAHPFLALFGLFAIFRFLDEDQKALKSCNESLHNLSYEIDEQHGLIPQAGSNDLNIDLNFDDETFRGVRVTGGTVTKIEKDGGNTVIHITWEM